MTDQELLARIAVDSKVLSGRPIVRGTRLSVEHILNLLAHGMTSPEITAEYEGLSANDISACLLFAGESLSRTDFMPLILKTAQVHFLCDECTGSSVVRWPRRLGHDVLSFYDEARGSSDQAILTKAYDEGWIPGTDDKDFGHVIFRKRRPHQGVVFLRLADERPASKIRPLSQVVENYADRLPGKFVTVTVDKIRFP